MSVVGTSDLGIFVSIFWIFFTWAVLSDEQMRKIWPFSLLNDEQMSNWVGVKHQPVTYCYTHCLSRDFFLKQKSSANTTLFHYSTGDVIFCFRTLPRTPEVVVSVIKKICFPLDHDGPLLETK